MQIKDILNDIVSVSKSMTKYFVWERSTLYLLLKYLEILNDLRSSYEFWELNMWPIQIWKGIVSALL